MKTLINQKLKKLAENNKKSWIDFHKTHLSDNKPKSDEMIFVIKHHLYIENIFNHIFESLFPNSNALKTLSFSNKIIVIESLNLNHDKTHIVVLKELNKIRNKFAHDINYKIKREDLRKVCILLKIPKSLKVRDQLARISAYLIGYMHALKATAELFPIGCLLINFSDKFAKDGGLDSTSTCDIYPWKLIQEAIDQLN